MRLKQIEYAQLVGRDEEWSIKRPGDLDGIILSDVNLLVGKNATGKSRTLRVIKALADVIIGKKRKPDEAHWKASFEHDEADAHYELKIVGGEVETEHLTVGSNTPLTRGADGTGRILAEEVGQEMEFKIPNETPAVIAKRDQIQHPFLEPLHRWAQQLRYYEFGRDMGRNTLFVMGSPEQLVEPDLNESNNIIPIFLIGQEKYGDEFNTRIVKEMGKIDYSLKQVVVREMEHIAIGGQHPLGFAAREADLDGETVQPEMSQGMFRVLSLIVHIVYAEMSGGASCVLVDDIGEGLDFDRSRRLIELLVDKARNDKFQLIMATNDRFVMNAVPMEEWSCLRRSVRSTEVLNHENSKDLFDEFKLTGLANFDFLTTGYFSASGDDA